ncbi:MAG: hypothetical protein EKK48_12090 [Candidatus Melainabacteria bacterium]|nr:MAG: hypothetical protein EKK48_12090 [Candidatus Melainabacteria bacterium]
MLTDDEHALVKRIGGLASLFEKIFGKEHPADLVEACNHIHALQNMVLSNCAARCYPYQYRLLGHTAVAKKDGDNA